MSTVLPGSEDSETALLATGETRFLLVDDTPDFRRLVEVLINRRGRGWQVVATASDGQEGVDLARSAQPDLVLLDLVMPVMDGLEALPLVREVAPNSLVVVLTAFPSQTVRESVFDAGADGFVDKDELVSQLVPTLEAVISAPRPTDGPRAAADTRS